MAAVAQSEAAPADGRLDAAAIQRLLLERICLLRYKPGDQLKESALAAEFGVSRTPLRDALNRISHLGLIESRNGVGTVVVELTPQHLRHVYEMRLELATLIGKLSPVTPTAQQIAELRDLLQQARALRRDFAADDYVRLNHRLNELIAALIGNASLRSMWLQTYVQAASTWHRVAETMGAEVAETLVAELGDLAGAVERGDMAAVGYIQRIYIGYGFTKVKQLYEA